MNTIPKDIWCDVIYIIKAI